MRTVPPSIRPRASSEGSLSVTSVNILDLLSLSAFSNFLILS